MDSGPEDDEDGDGSEPSMDLESAPCGPEENEDESRELTEEELP